MHWLHQTKYNRTSWILNLGSMSILLVSRSTNIAREKHKYWKRTQVRQTIQNKAQTFSWGIRRAQVTWKNSLIERTEAKLKVLIWKPLYFPAPQLLKTEGKESVTSNQFLFCFSTNSNNSVSLIKNEFFFKGVNHYRIKTNFKSASYSQRRGSVLSTAIAWFTHQNSEPKAKKCNRSTSVSSAVSVVALINSLAPPSEKACTGMASFKRANKN